MQSKLFMITLFCLCLAACGIKPKNVEPPEEAKNKSYPAHYPSDVSK